MQGSALNTQDQVKSNRTEQPTGHHKHLQSVLDTKKKKSECSLSPTTAFYSVAKRLSYIFLNINSL